MSSLQELKSCVGSQWQAGTGEAIVSICPYDDSVVANGKAASQSQVDAAFVAARSATVDWARIGCDHRIAVVKKYAELVREHAEELADLISRETGKPRWETLTEAGAVASKVDISIEAFRDRRDTRSFQMGGSKAVTRFKPHGVCGVLGPFNFPAHLPNGHIVPALICGNTVVFKPSEITPATGQWMMQKWIEAGVPDGVLNLVHGGREVGQAIAGHGDLDGLFFTGSSNAGVALSKTLAPAPQKILALEMGGNNPLIVHETSDVEAAAYLTVLSAYMTSGQRCSCARRLIVVDGSEANRFLEQLVESISNIRVGFASDSPEPFMGTVIHGTMGRQLIDAQTKLIASGGESIVAMKSLRECDALVSPGLIDVTKIKDREDEELFGPLLNVIRVKDFDAAIEEANRTKYGLAAGLLSDSELHYQQFIASIRAGVVNW
ncbi:UNVERIFIED_CONTAM: hypothetical protein GTU68_061334, partial [Idotea baltica]|nr:hypothetical protein [Idotea baltica]